MKLALLQLRMTKLVSALSSPLLRRALVKHRVLGATEHLAVLSRRFGCLVDVGANKGQFSLAFRRANPSAPIFAFEPLPTAAAVYRNVFGADPGVRLFELALGPAETAATLHVSGRDDSSSLLPIGSLQMAVFPGTEEVATSTVRVARLASLLGYEQLAAPALLKIDVQGFELEVLRGSDELLDRFSVVYCECSFIPLYESQALAHQVIAYLARRGFALSGFCNPAFAPDGSTIQADFVFERAAAGNAGLPAA